MPPSIWHPFTQLRDFEPLGTVERARGAWLHLSDGRRLLDGIASWWVIVHGHSHPAIVAAIAEQAGRLDQVILADFDHPPARDLSARLAAILPGDLSHLFFSDDGSTAVEVAVKMAWQAQQARGEGHRTRLVALEAGYHGDTLGAMTVGARDVFTEPFHDLLGDVHFLPFDDGGAAERFFAAHGHEVAAVVFEPLVQGAGGMRMGSPEALRRLVTAAQDAGAYAIADEVATGFGRTGRMWACEHAGVVPDLLCMSKGITGGALPLGATACTPAIHDLFLGDDKRTAFLHGHSYAGNPIACAAALASLDLFETEDTLARVARIEALWREHLPRFAALPGVRNVRCRGLFFAFDVEHGPGGYLDPIGARIQAAALQEGLYVRPLGHVVYLLPPVCVSEDDLRWALEVLREATATALSPAG